MKRYWRFLVPAGAIVVVLVFLLVTLSGNLVYFKTPTEVNSDPVAVDSRLRLGGEVEVGSVTETTGGVAFSVTDGRVAVDVVHTGTPQELFREKIHVVLEGTWDGSTFHSDTMLIKHDEQYRVDDDRFSDQDGRYVPPTDETTGS